MKSIRIKYTAITKTGYFEFVNTAGGIRQALEKNADIFNSPPISLQILGEAVKNLIQKVNRANFGSRNDKNNRDLQKSVVLNILMMTGAYVIGVANTKKTFEEKAAIVQLAGYTVAEGPNKRVGTISAANNLKVSASSTPGLGWVDLCWKRGGKGVYSFSIQAMQGYPDINTKWDTLGTSMNTKFELRGLKSGV